jgi:uncharacterized protein YutD
MKVRQKTYFLQTPHIACWNFSTYVIRYVNFGCFFLTRIQQFKNEAIAFKTNRPKSVLNKTQNLSINGDGGMSLNILLTFYKEYWSSCTCDGWSKGKGFP